jgi:hypothetical protein
MPYIILIPAHRLGKFISHLGVRHYITKTHLGGQDTLQEAAALLAANLLNFLATPSEALVFLGWGVRCWIIFWSYYALLSLLDSTL